MVKILNIWVLCIVMLSCSTEAGNTMLLVFPDGIGGPHRNGDDISWRVRWLGAELEIEGMQNVRIPYSSVVTAQAYDQYGMPIGFPVGAISRWSENTSILQLAYELGFTAVCALILQEAGADIAIFNLERLQLLAMQVSDGRPFLLDSMKAAGLLLAGNVMAHDIRPELIEIPEDLLGWRIHYPPKTNMPRRLRPGLYMIWHPFEGNGWLNIQAGNLSWSMFSPD